MSSRALVLVVVFLALQSCARGNARDVTAEEIALADKRLQGSWLLVDARPNPPLDGTLDALMRMQLGTMILTFDRGTMVAQGQGIRLRRSYRIIRWEGFGRVHVELVDETGDRDEVEATFEDDTIRFNGLDYPWRGGGVIKRTKR